MSHFDLWFEEARARQYRVYFFISGGVFVGAILLTAILTFTNGTSIKIFPDDAGNIGSVSVVRGFGFSLNHVVYGLTNDLDINISAHGYKSENLTITPTERGKSLPIVLRELPGQLTVNTIPPDDRSRWKIDGNLVAIGPNLDIQLKAGVYNLEIDSSFYEVENQKISLDRAERKKISFNLKPVEGELQISSSPNGANVYLDGAKAGTTPFSRKSQGGAHRLQLSSPDYIVIDDILEITNDNPVASRNYRLKRTPATLSFNLTPKDGQLLVNGKIISPHEPYVVDASVENIITYLKDGYVEQSTKLILYPSENRAIAFDLRLDLGEVRINSTPKSTITVNGRKMGETPLSLSLPAIPQKIVLLKDGFRKVERTITPSSKMITTIDEVLVTELLARLSKAPKEYSNSVGISLVLFIPSSFVMGAPRHEIGQRANEFLQNVNLTKPFYAAKHETTNEQYGKFKKGHSGTPRQPVTSISWLEAALFCNWLSGQEGITPFYKITGNTLHGINKESDGYRLLTEAEWEWLARKSHKDRQTIFPWGDDPILPPGAGNIADESSKGTTKVYVPKYNDGFAGIAPVGSYKAEASGLFDLLGNASEWVHDFYSVTPPNPNVVLTNPLGPEYGDSHVVKGSSWQTGSRTQLRAAYRDGLLEKRDDVGFRVGRYLYGGGNDEVIQ